MSKLMRVSDGISRREGALEGAQEAIKLTVTKVELKVKVSEGLETLKPKLIETKTRIKQLIFAKGELTKNQALEGRLNALEGASKHMEMFHRTRITISQNHSKVTSVLRCSQFSFVNQSPLYGPPLPFGIA